MIKKVDQYTFASFKHIRTPQKEVKRKNTQNYKKKKEVIKKKGVSSLWW